MQDPLDARRPTAAATLRRTAFVLLLAVAGALVLLVSTAQHPPTASAASCMVVPYHSYGGGLLVLGASECGGKPLTKETFIVYCEADGNIHSLYNFEDETGPYPQLDTADGPCSALEGVVVNGLGGTDGIDLTRVTAADGFTGITGTNSIDGGDGPDRLLGSGFSDAVTGGPDTDVVQVRDGRADTVDCGVGFDAVEADQPSLDALTGCEIVDALPEPQVVAPPQVLSPTGQRAAALEKCKQKKTKKKRKKCRAKAQTLPA